MQKTVAQTSPYIRKATSTKRMMIDVLIALIPVSAFAIYKFQFDFILKALVAIVLAVLVEVVAVYFMKGRKDFKITINNIIPPIITALIFTLTLSHNASLYLVIIGILFAMIIGKMIFGGLGKNIFNPAGLGRAFVALSLGSLMNGYIGPDSVSGVTGLSQTYPSILNNYSLFDLFLGNVPGSMGEISALAIIIGGAYLLIRKSADFRIVLAALGSFTLMAVIGGLALGHGNQIVDFTLYHVLSGGLLFGIMFMATDPITSPYTGPGRLIYGLIIGSLVAIIRFFGLLPEGMVFAILIANALVPLIDYKKWTNSVYTKRFVIGYTVSILVIALIVFAGLGGF